MGDIILPVIIHGVTGRMGRIALRALQRIAQEGSLHLDADVVRPVGIGVSRSQAALEDLSREAGLEHYSTDLRAAVGPGIRGGCYQVSADVVERFEEAGFPESLYPRDGDRFLLDIEAAIGLSLAAAGVHGDTVEYLGRCTHCEPDEFYSHRRDAGLTGRSWAFIRATAPAADTTSARHGAV